MVVDIDKVLDGRLQLSDVLEAPATNTLVRYLAEPTLYKIQPGRTCRNEMNVESSVAFQPSVDLVVFVCAVVVDDHVYLQSGVRFLVDLPQEAEEFLMPMARHTFGNDLVHPGKAG